MKIITTLSIAALLGAMLISCSKTGVKPSISKADLDKTGSAADTTITQQNTPPSSIPQSSPNLNINPALIGNWTLVSDSTYFNRGESTAFDRSSGYAAQQGDYLNITNNGYMYLKEGATIDTITYAVQTANDVQLKYAFYPNIVVNGGTGVYAELNQVNISNNTAVLGSSSVTPGGVFSRKFYLKK